MSAARHTAGPWFPTKDSAYNEVARVGRAWNISTLLAMSDMGNADADAKLIAAAPDMFSALNAVAEKLGSRPYGTGSYLPKALRDQVRAAIAKATGSAA